MVQKSERTNDKALAAFIAAKTEIDRLLEELTALSTEHFHASPCAVTWGHVGSANHIRARLQEIASFAKNEG